MNQNIDWVFKIINNIFIILVILKFKLNRLYVDLVRRFSEICLR